jgi:hypothetical protein
MSHLRYFSDASRQARPGGMTCPCGRQYQPFRRRDEARVNYRPSGLCAACWRHRKLCHGLVGNCGHDLEPFTRRCAVCLRRRLQAGDRK